MANKEIPFDYNEFKLLNGTNSLDSFFFDETFITQVGTIRALEFINQPYFATVFDDKIDDLIDVSENIHTELYTLLNCLWFVKDCSISPSSLYYYSFDTKHVFSRNRTANPSNSKGEYEVTEIALENLNMAETISRKFLRDISKINRRPVKLAMNQVNKSHTPFTHYLNYNILTRLERAMTFLNTARSNSFLPMKIASYMSVFECLFTTDSTEVTHKVAERTAVYLNTTKADILATFRGVKKAYNYRSKFIHGQGFEEKKDTHDHLTEISTTIDNILRKIFKKVMLEDFELFNGSNNSILEEYFTKSLFDRGN